MELCDIDDLGAVVGVKLGARLAELPKAESIIVGEIDRFLERQRRAELAPTTSALVSSAESIRLAELERVRRGLEGLTPEQHALVDHLSRRLVAKMLHTPIKNAKDLANSQQGHLYLGVLRELFELDEDVQDELD